MIRNDVGRPSLVELKTEIFRPEIIAAVSPFRESKPYPYAQLPARFSYPSLKASPKKGYVHLSRVFCCFKVFVTFNLKVKIRTIPTKGIIVDAQFFSKITSPWWFDSQKNQDHYDYLYSSRVDVLSDSLVLWRQSIGTIFTAFDEPEYLMVDPLSSKTEIPPGDIQIELSGQLAGNQLLLT
jgi:hypothetical protein